MSLLDAAKEYMDPEMLTSYAVEYGVAIIGAIIVFIIGKIIAKTLTGIARKVMKKAEMDKTIVKFLGNIIYGILFAFVVIAALSQLGVETASLAAIFAAAGLAIGLALQGSLSNFAAGVLIIAFRPFKVDDYVGIAGVEGKISEVSIFTTTLISSDNKVIIIPNGQITDGVITNFTNLKTRRVDMVFGIGYGDDIKKAKEVLQSIVDDNPLILKEPSADLFVSELADSSVNFKLRPWVNTENYSTVLGQVHEAVKLRFDEENISIPFPQRDVHMHQAA